MQIIVMDMLGVLNQVLNRSRKTSPLDISISRVRLPILSIVTENEMLKGVAL